MSIRIESLQKHFHKQMVFDDYSVTIPERKTTLITGPSGCGKTTLLRIIARLDKRYHGIVSNVPHKISYLFQEDRLLPWFTLQQNVEFVLKDIFAPQEVSRIALQMIKAVKLDGHEDKFPAKLSGGMKRRTALARTFAYPCDLLILDEPFKGLDAALKDDMIALFDKLFVQANKTVIIVSHDEAVLERIDCNVITI
ncbi:MAG: ATP-binding cassette domain-containing protein [Clostridia bacterium]|jgi:NitT/TauT family transport system ATP-binding protein|nr:ATP-binding cassette domain-containing protein [Clostridia bacterium]MBT7121649.1 ATP-binding cassette domain-containing protein [Clostridia bacterium]